MLRYFFVCFIYYSCGTIFYYYRQFVQAKLRMKALRDRRKEQGGPATRAPQEEKRAKWREEKKQQTAKMTPQRRRRLNEKRRAKYHEKKILKSNGISNQQAASNAETPASFIGDITPAAKRKALSRARAAMPKSPRKYAQILLGLHEQASPNKKKNHYPENGIQRLSPFIQNWDAG